MLAPDQVPATRYGLPTIFGAFACLSFGTALAGLLGDRDSTNITQYFFAVQDTPVLGLLGAVFTAFAILTARGTPSATGPSKRLFGPGFAVAVAIAVTALAYLGARFVYLSYALSVDEFMAEFDARIFASGRLIAAVAPDWRDYVPAMQPIFRLPVPDNAFWASLYLPMNAVIRSLFLLAGDPALANAVLASLAVAALGGVARLLWPARPDAAVVAVILLACSSQFLIMAMTPYAMTAHLAFNLVWLWLFLRDTRVSHALAAPVAFVACGLHQLVFHPLFAAPFVLSLFVARRWTLAAWYTAVYAVAALFWILYWSLLLHGVGAPAAAGADVGMGNFIHRVLGLIAIGPEGIGLMTLNLLRLLAWQAPIALPLAIFGLLAARGRDVMINCLAIGILFMVGLVLVVLPYQGHGWGYRYLHGFLGSIALMAAYGWIAATQDESSRKPLAVTLAASTALAALVLLPWRACQVRSVVAPYAAASQLIARSKADVVLVDPADSWFAVDLVRNDPLLRSSPKVMVVGAIDDATLTRLCRSRDVAVFDHADAQRLGIRDEPLPAAAAERFRGPRKLMASLGCGRPVSETLN